MICLYLRYAKIMFLLWKNNYFQWFSCILKVMMFIVVLCIFRRFRCQLLMYFRILFEHNFVHRCLIVFWFKKDAQNGPKIMSKSTPVRPRAASGFLASSGHLWTRNFCDFWCQNGSQNNLKMTQSSPQWCPGPSKYRTFLQTVALASSFWAFQAAFPFICW